MSQISPETEYEQKWEYLRHIEESRRKSVQLFFLLIGGVGSYLATVEWELNSASALPVAGVLLILTIVAFFLLHFLVFQKVEYRRHLKRIDEMDGCSMAGEEEKVEDPFRWFFAAVQATGAAIAGTLVGVMVVPGAIEIAIWLDWPIPWGAALPMIGIFLGIGAAITFWRYFDFVVEKSLVEGWRP